MANKNELNEKIDEILLNQRKILANENKILGEEAKIEMMESDELSKEDINQKTEEDALNELIHLEKQIKKNNANPIRSITKRDVFKGFVGAFAGLVSHFAFSEGFELGEHLSYFQATILYIVAFVTINVMLYYTGFRKVQRHLVFKFMPLRAVILYIVSIFTIVLVYILFGQLHFPIHIYELYTLVGSSITLTVMGAGTADLIGSSGEH